eukprot:566535-Amphidinium_carterae.1
MTSTTRRYLLCVSLSLLGHATVVPYKGINQEAVRALARFIVESGLQSTILQSVRLLLSLRQS